MSKKIRNILWKEELRDKFIEEYEIDNHNSYINFHNDLEEDTIPQKMVRYYLQYAIQKDLIDILSIDINLEGYGKSIDDNEVEVMQITSLVNDFLRIYKKEYLNQEYSRFVYSQFQGLLADFVQEKGLSKGEYEMFAYMIAEKDKIGELDEIENDKEREVAIMMLIEDVFEEFCKNFLDK